MRDMFYKYDYEIDKKEYVKPLCTNKPKELDTYTNIRPLYNVQGEKIGLKANKNSKFSLYFNIFGSINNNKDIHEYLKESNFIFNILDFKREVIFTKEAFIDSDENFIKVDLEANENGILRTGVYRMQLNMEVIGGGPVSLFSDTDAILSIE